MPTPSLSPFAQRTLLVLGLYTASAWALILIALVAWAPGRSMARTALAHVAEAATSASSPASTGFALAQGTALYALSGAPASEVCDVPCPVAAETPVVLAGMSNDDDHDGFSWRVRSKDGHSWSDAWDMDRDSPEGDEWFWFREDGVSYVVRDPAIVAEARDATEPLRESGAQIGKVGGELGRNGARMGRLGGRMGAVAARIAALHVQSASQSARDSRSPEIIRLRAEFDALQRELEAEQAVHERENAALNKKLSELSAKHAEILKDVRQKVREIAARARREGRAERPHAKA
jgi:hypothetical protein